MALILCKVCGQAFINGPRSEVVCPDCEARLNGIYPAVRALLRNDAHTPYTASGVSRKLGVSLRDVEGLVAMGLIEERSDKGVLDEARGKQKKGDGGRK